MRGDLLYHDLAEHYDLLHPDKDYRKEATDLLRVARQALGRPPRSLLDVGCGTGRHLAEFARTLSVRGVDRSPQMLRLARLRLGPQVPLDRGDMRSFQLGSTFEVVTCLFSAIGHLEGRRDRDRALANFYRHLVPGGVALVEGWYLPSRWRGARVRLDEYEDRDTLVARILSAWRQDGHSAVDTHYLIAERGRKTRHFQSFDRLPLVTAKEMIASFRRAGFYARVLLQGRYRNRGLYVGVKPAQGRGEARRDR
jgi:SAM-dependent methyltransferase